MRRANRYTRRERQTRIFRPGRMILTLFVVAAIGSSVWKLWELQRDVERQLTELSQQKETLLAEQKVLETEIERLNTPSYIEQLAREQLGLVRQGEIMIAPKK